MDDAPDGYGFDFVNSDVVLHKLSLKDGRLVTQSGSSYRVLYLGGRSQRMTLPVLRKIDDLVTQGAVLVGKRPTDSPSLADDESEFQRIADRLWGRKAAPKPGVLKVGKGRVYASASANGALADLGVARDFEYTKPQPDSTLMVAHRKLDDGEIYYVDNRTDRAESVDATFRVDGKAAELWDAATGATQAASYKIDAGRTTVPLHLDPYGTTFVVFRKQAAASSLEAPNPRESAIAGLDDTLNQNWTVTFEPGRGAPSSAAFDGLASWSENSDYGIKYFSGTATYAKTIDIPDSALAPGAHIWLDLGDVKDVAEVAVNGQSLGILWKTPFKIDVTSALKPGGNRIEVKVTNLWVNRLIGDQQPWALRKYVFADIAPYKADSPLLPSGLIGPVQLLSVSAQ
jgi:hypothetical protein